MLIFKSSYCSTHSNEIYSLRLAPSMKGVAVASQVLCTSTTLNKRKQCRKNNRIANDQYEVSISVNKIHQQRLYVN